MRRKATRSEHYLAIAGFYGSQLAEDIRNPHVPEFVIAHEARRAAHFALAGIRLQECRRRGDAAWVGPGAAFTAVASASLS